MAAYATHLLRRSELQTIDARFSIRGKRKAPSNIVLVQIDNATLQQLKHTQFPFPRRYDARVIDRLRRGGAAAIVLDLEFTQQTDARDDDALIEALETAPGRTVLAASQIGPGGQTGVLGGGSLLHELKARAADDRLVLDSDGVARRFARSLSGLNSMPVVAVEVARRRPVPASLFDGGTLPIDFVGPSESFTRSPTRRCSKANSRRACSPARSRSSAPRRRSSATFTRRRRAAHARCPATKSSPTRRARCCAACRCATHPARSTSC